MVGWWGRSGTPRTTGAVPAADPGRQRLVRLASVGWLTGEGSGEERRGLGRDGGDSWAYVEEVQLVRCAADADGEEEEVTL